MASWLAACLPALPEGRKDSTDLAPVAGNGSVQQ